MKRSLGEILHAQINNINNAFRIKAGDVNIEDNGRLSACARQTFVALGPLLLTIGLGMTSGYSAILLPQLEAEKNGTLSIDSEQASWIASMAALPMATGCILGGTLNEKFGRRSAHMITCVPTLIGWLFISFAFNTKMILTGRFITGFCTGMLAPATGVYIGETSEPKYRGFLLGGISFAVSLGLFLSHLLGTFFHWQTTALVCSAVPVLSLIVMVFVPESPAWLAKKGRTDKAEESFYWCRGSSETAKRELAVILERQHAHPQADQRTLKETCQELMVPEFLKPLGIISVYIMANQWAGVNAIAFYTVSIMKETIGDGVNEYAAMLAVDAIRVLMSILACVLMRRLGRRPLALVSCIGTTVALFALSGFTYLAKTYQGIASASYIPMTALVAYISFISIGFVPLPWAMIGEIFPLKSRSIGSGISSFLAFTAFFSVVKTSPGMFRNLGTAGTFSVYGMVASLATVFVFFYLPETRGRALHEIEDRFKGKSDTVPMTESKFIKRDKDGVGKNGTKENEHNFSPRIRQCYVASGVLLISVSLGMVQGYSATLLPQLEKEGHMAIDHEMSSWIASISVLPTPFGCVLGGWLMEKIGRKTIHMASCVPCLAGWVLIYFSKNTTTLLIGRFTTGICLGILGPPSGVYVAETSDPNFRGFLLASISLAINLGIVTAHVLGSYLSWQNTALVGAAFPIICLIVMAFAPESPTFLAKKSKIAESKKAFYWCRGYSDGAQLELQELLTRQTALTNLPDRTCCGYVNHLAKPEFLKPLAIILIFFFTSQWCGTNALNFYSVDIINQTLGGSYDGYTSMIIMDAVRLTMAVLTCFLMRSLGRRPLAMLSCVGTTLSLFTLSGFSIGTIFVPNLKDYSAIALVALIAYILFTTIGLAPMPWTMMGELFPLAYRGMGSATSALVNYAFIFSVVKSTPWMLLNMGTFGTFLLFGIVSLMGTVILAIFLPETKNKPLHEIEDQFKGKEVTTGLGFNKLSS